MCIECLPNNLGGGVYSQVKPTYVRTWGLKRGRVYTRRGLISGRLRYFMSLIYGVESLIDTAQA